jgi:hypothetical protein
MTKKMLIARQIALCVAISLAISGVSWGQSQKPPASSNPPSNENTQPAPRDQRGTDQSPLAIKIIPGTDSKQKTEQEERERKEKTDIETRLADETQRIADYTKFLSVFTAALLAAAIGQIVLFWYQLGYMATGVKDAGIAATSAKEATKNAKESFEKLERPYIFIYEPKPFAISRSKPMNQQPFVKYTVGSWGKTPAIVKFISTVINTGDEPGMPLRADYSHPLVVAPVLPPKYTYEIDEEAPARITFAMKENSDTIFPVLENKDTLFFRVIITYSGPISDRHQTSACWRYDGVSNRFVQHGSTEYNYMK